MDSATALKNLQDYQSKIVSPDQAAEQANQQLGVGGAQETVKGLRGAIQKTSGLLQQVAPSVYGRTQNSLVTTAQAGRQIANEQAPIAQQLETQNRDYGTASQDYQDLLSKAQAKASGMLQGQQTQLSYLQQIYQDMAAREQAQKDEAFRQAQLAEQQRQANMSAARAGAGSAGASPSFGGLASLLGGGGGAQPGVQDHFQADLATLLPADYATRFNPGYTERTVIPKLQKLYPELGNKVANMVYQYRKQFERR